ncbi:MAG TPA: M23 family metallopeptidase, partial [Turneriella sp.]|nr:M23 family metallopeptidase [Turneriella sp.]
MTIFTFTIRAEGVVYEWPAEKDKKNQISSTFGESRLDHFHNGIDLPGKGAKILAPRDGRVLYRVNADFTPGEMPFGGGNTLILEHGTSASTHWTGYMHLTTFADSVLEDNPISTGDKIGVTGDTGHSGGPHLHFFIYAPHERTMLNPLLFMNDLYYDDTLAPEIKEWGVLLNDKFSTVNPKKPFRLSQDYPVYIFLQDHGRGKERWGVFDYRVVLDNKEVLKTTFDKIFFKDGEWVLSSGHKFEDIFYRNFYSLTRQLRRSKEVFVEAKDIKGNTFSQKYT